MTATVVLYLAASVLAEAGLSEIVNARAFWVRRPYALIRDGDIDMGPRYVSLILGREETFKERLDFLPRGICGIVETERLLEGIGDFAAEGDLLVMKLVDISSRGISHTHQFAVVDLSSNRFGTFVLQDEQALAHYLKARGVDPRSLEFVTFDEGCTRAHAAEKLSQLLWITAVVALVAGPITVLACASVWLIKNRRRRRAASAESP